MNFREGLIDAIAHKMDALGLLDPYGATDDVLNAALAFRQTVECPDCGGTGYTAVKEWRGPEHDNRCPAGCIDGRLPGETRLAIVEPAERLPAFSDVLREGPPVFLLAPDLPETEK